tara:strand:- start:9863 stop:10273 length:411 start_codon:yes stop_codon:yes gene_type:complete
MKLSKINLRDYCTPALIYLGISSIVVIMLVLQNIFNKDDNQLCIGAYKCTFTHKLLVLVFKVLYILFWTWILNYLCKKGYKGLSWFLILIPFLLAAVIIGAVLLIAPGMIYGSSQHTGHQSGHNNNHKSGHHSNHH